MIIRTCKGISETYTDLELVEKLVISSFKLNKKNAPYILYECTWIITFG